MVEGRYQLGQLLAEEDRKYQQEIVDMEETPEKMRERMAQRVKELK